MRFATQLLVVVVLCGAVSSALAAQRRYAIVIGNNLGAPDDKPLRYAERDAQRVARTLQNWGGVAGQDLLLLVGADAPAVEAQLRRMVAEVDSSGDTVLIVFYSGHGDGEFLHLSGTRLPLTTLHRIIGAAPAKVRLLVVDACQSGELTRVKGASPAEPFRITAEDRLDTEGVAIITSSAAGEDAQESERLQGGVFTHHFITGLRGAADESGDRRVTLREVYNYAYDQTLRSTTRARASQHPTFAFALRGRQDLVMTKLSGGTVGRVRFNDAGEFSVLQAHASGRTVAEVNVEGSTEIVLEPGEYLIRMRTDSAVYEVRVTVSSGQVTVIELGNMTPRAFGQASSKGWGSNAPGAVREAEAPSSSVHRKPGPTPAGRQWLIALSLGRAAGYVKGKTEQQRQEIGCCAAVEHRHYALEVGTWVDSLWMLSGIFRWTDTGADLSGHSSGAPSLSARFTRARQVDHHGLSVYTQLGYGLIRYDVQLAEPASEAEGGGSIDAVAVGPWLFGAGARYGFELGQGLQLYAEGSVLVALATGGGSVGDVRTESALHLDLSAGVAWTY